MTTTLDIINSAKDLDPAEYRAFFLQSKAPLFLRSAISYRG